MKLDFNTLYEIKQIVNKTINEKYMNNDIIINNNEIEIILYPYHKFITLNDNSNILSSYILKQLDYFKELNFKVTIIKTLEEYETNNQ